MGIIDSILQQTSGFRSRLLTIVTLGILGLALIASLTTAWVTSRSAAEQMIAQGLQVVETLANQSVLALLYESPENAARPLDAIMSFPDIIQAGIYRTDREPLSRKGRGLGALSPDINLPTETATLTSEDRTAWHFAAPVLTGRSADQETDEDHQFQLDTTNTELLGYAHVIMDKSTLRTMQINVFLNNIVIALSFALLLIIFVNFGIDRLTRPLFQLIRVMEENEKDGTRVYADLKGPKEFSHLTKVFNNMLSSIEERDRRLREHGEKLESEVAIRTRELVEARDVALTASRHKSEFLANISHELRTPLQAIIGYTDLVREDLEMEGLEENATELERVINNAQRLLAMINNILDMAKIESGHMDINLQPVYLTEALQETADTIKPILKYNNNRIIFDVPETDNEIVIDREKLMQIVLNLLSNATKFTQKGTIWLTAKQSPQDLEISVKDTGIGLTVEQQRVVFEEFRQVDGSTTRSFEGTGLGLAITRRFTELLGGSISVDSKLGQGACFTVRIPLPVDMANNRAQPALSA